MASITTRTGKRGKTWKVHYRDPAGHSRSQSFKKAGDARAFAATVEADKLRGEYVGTAGARTRFADVAAEVMDAKKHSVRPSTIVRDESVMRSLVLPVFGDKPLGSITPATVQAYVNKLAATHAPATVSKAHQLVANVLDAAVDHDLIAKSPDRGVKLPKQERREMRFLTSGEINRLADAIDERWRPLVLVGAFCGLRFGEAIGLTVDTDSLDVLRRRITVGKQLTEVRGEVRFSEPKTRAARRVVALPAFLVDVLAAHLAEHGRGPGELVFQAAEGGPIRRTNFRRRVWEPAVAAAGLEDVTFHALRHSHVAMLIGQGEHPSMIAARLGHASVKTTLDLYGHLLPGTDEAAAERLDATMANGG